MKISVVIPHLRGEETLLPLLDDLKLEYDRFAGALEVVLVDNASTDGSVPAAELRHPWIRVHHRETNEGFAGGCNRGVEVATGEWIWLLNDDVRLEEGVVEKMLAVAESAGDVAAVQPKVMSMREPGHFDYAGGAGGMMDWFGYPFALGRVGGVLERDEGQYDDVREIFWASGTACLWRKETLDQIGLLDESFFAHMEEIDLAWRAWNSGWRILSAPSASVVHLGGGTLSYQAWRKMYLNHRNSLITIAKNRETSALFFLLIARLFLDNGVGVAELFLGRPNRITAVWSGWWDFVKQAPDWLAARKKAQALRCRKDSELQHITYFGSILFAYMVGKKSASSLVARRPTQR